MGAEQLLSPTPSAAAAEADTGRAWAPHGRLLTACLVALNVFLVLLVYFYFWRFFTRPPRSGDEEDQDDAASSEAGPSPPASPKARDRREVERAITALPVFVHSSSDFSGADGGASSAECAICIAEFADGEEGRLLPRCGHRFHVRCVDTWFRFHTTCPLCRASVLLHDDADDAPSPAVTTDRSSDADADCPV